MSNHATLRGALSVVAVLIAAGCASLMTSSATPSAVGATLRGEALRAALAGNDMRPAEIVAGAFERFCESGAWHVVGARAPVRGTFAIDGDEFCVSRPGGAISCRRLYQNSMGVYFMSDVDALAETPPYEVDLTRSIAAC